MKIPYNKIFKDHNEINNLQTAIKDFRLTHSRFCNQFEKDFSDLLNVRHTLLVNSGSSANLLAFMALTQDDLGDRRIKKDDEIITTACCFPTTLAPIVQFGAVPVFVDITVPEYNIDVTQLEKALSDKTKAVMIAHTLGNPFNVKVVKEFCNKNNLWLVEDSCDALMSKYSLDEKASYTGSFGDISTFSFYPAHHITGGEAGAVCTNNNELKDIMLSLRDWGRDCKCSSGVDNACGHRFDNEFNYDHKYVYSRFGYNLKATEFQAAILVAQLNKLKRIRRNRINNWNYFKHYLSNTDKYILPKATDNSDPCWFGFVLTSLSKSNIDIQKQLEGYGIQTRPIFAGNILRQPCFKNVKHRVIGKLLNTDMITDKSFWFGVHPLLTLEEKQYIINTLKSLS